MKNIKISNKLTSLLVSGATLFTLTGCFGVPKKEYVPMSEIFHDDNKEGYDDAFEHIISDSYLQIEKIVKLEKSMNLVKKLLEIDFSNIYYDFPEDEMLENIDGFSVEELDIIDSEIEIYKKMSSDDVKFESKEEREHYLNLKKSELYRKFVILTNYIDYYAENTLYYFGQKLYDSIFLSTGGYNGNETNISAEINGYGGSSVQPRNMATYSNDGVKETIEIIEGSQIYNLVGEVDEYRESQSLPTKKVNHTSYTDKQKKDLLKKLAEYEETLLLYKESLATRYAIKPKVNGLFSFLEDYNYDKIIECQGTDESVYVKK